MNQIDSLIELLERVSAGAAGATDFRAIRELINADQSGELAARVHSFYSAGIENKEVYDHAFWQSALDEILNVDKAESEPVIPIRRIHSVRFWAAAAAAVVILLGSTVYFEFFHQKKSTANSSAENTIATTAILPGTNKATLTLANGSRILLDSARTGTVAVQGNSNVVKLDNGKLTYKETTEKPTAISYNTLTTPRGGQYEVTLPDGTKVWLNAASSITYPTAFTGKDRKVTITGEAYFEVVHDPAKPFSVSTRGIEVQDIGTHFDINAYTDEESIRTTLVEGKINLKKDRQSKILVPGEQASISEQSDQIKIKTVDTENVIAWKNGFFHFDEANIQTVMRELARWYDIDVQFEKPISDHLYGGKISRNLDLNQVLDVLKTNNIQFKIDGRKIIVE